MDELQKKFLEVLNDEYVDQDREEILPDYQGKMKITVSEIEKAFEDNGISFTPFNNDFELWQSLDKLGKLSDVHFVIKSCLEDKKISFKPRELGHTKKDALIALFFNVFDVDPKSEFTIEVETETPPLPSDPLIINEPTIIDDPPKSQQNKSTKKILSLDFKIMQEIFSAAQKVYAEDLGFDVNDNITIYKNLPVTSIDHFWLKVPKNISVLYSCAALLKSKTNEIIAVGFLEDDKIDNGEIRPHLNFGIDNEHINYNQFENQTQYKILLLPADQENFFDENLNLVKVSTYEGKIYLLECNLKFEEELPTTKKSLCIDFGTSNITAGTYVNGEISLVNFRDVTIDQPSYSKILPSVVYVDSFKNDQPVYKFGYEAKKAIIESDFNIKSSVFYDIKRWILSPDDTEELIDRDGNILNQKIKHEEIIKSYIEYVIEKAELQFKVKFEKFSFTAPVKYKNRFENLIRKILSNYQIEVELNEAQANVYNYVNDQKSHGEFMIIDVGSATSDLIVSNYSVNSGESKIDIETKFLNSDTNFGGNNLTFRILQLLKIKLAAYIKGDDDKTIDEFITEDYDKILSMIDAKICNHKKIYEKLEAAYQSAEEILPTKFNAANDLGRNERRMIKRNYYYLWNIAEMIKQNPDCEIEIDLKKLHITNCQSTINNSTFRIPNSELLFLPEIYALMNKLLCNYLESKPNLSDIQYKFVGQTCNIKMFRELMKEFIPGRFLRRCQDDDSDLKTCCIEGLIKYIRDKAKGKIKPNFKNEIEKNFYNVYVDSTCLLSQNDELKFIKQSIDKNEIELIVKDGSDQIKRKINYEIDTNYNKQYEMNELFEEVKKNTTLNIEEFLRDLKLDIRSSENNDQYYLFILPDNEGYRFRIWQLKIDEEEKIYMPQPKIENFANESLKTYFNGDK